MDIRERSLTSGRALGNGELGTMGAMRKPRPRSIEAFTAAARKPRQPRQRDLDLGGVVPSESDVLRGCLALLAIHPKVAWAHRFNTGGVKFGNQWVKFAFPGCSDILGQMTDGRFLAVETKKPGARTGAKRLAAQVAFLTLVRAHGGVSAMVDTVDSLRRVLDAS